MGKNLIAYFSRTGENYVNGEIKELEVGNTEVIANILKEILEENVDVFKINPVHKYSSKYRECIEEAKQDLRKNARPELQEYPKSFEEYDTIYLGYPNYWGTMPMAVFTFLEHFDLTGKKILPFCTHEGSGMGNSENDIKKIVSNANILKGIAIRGGNVNDNSTRTNVNKWLAELGIK